MVRSSHTLIEAGIRVTLRIVMMISRMPHRLSNQDGDDDTGHSEGQAPVKAYKAASRCKAGQQPSVSTGAGLTAGPSGVSASG